jgi:hypothetical protein
MRQYSGLFDSLVRLLAMTLSTLLGAALALLYVVLGAYTTRLVYMRTGSSVLKVLLASLVCSFFFSIGIASGDRLALPVPTPILIFVLLHDIVTREACISTSDGLYCPHDGESWVLIPFAIQWAVWLLVFTVAYRVRRFARSGTQQESIAGNFPPA